MKYRIKNSMDFFSTLEEAEEYIRETENLSMEDLEILTDSEYDALFNEELTNIPDETSAKTPEEWMRAQKDKGSEPVTQTSS